MILKARYVAPVTSPVIEDGAVQIRGGRIAAIGAACDVVDESAIDFGEALICPGFVNAHTHLELTSCAGRVPPSRDFVDWLTRLVALSTSEPPSFADVCGAVCDGIARSLAAGVTAVGDITRFPAWTRSVLAGSKLRAVSFGEVVAIGKRRDRLSRRLDAAAAEAEASDRLRIGISPHAPYTVEPAALGICADRAAAIAAPLCIHLAETRAEREFTSARTGPFVDYLQRLGVWDDAIPTAGCSPVALADRCGVLTPRTIVAHANDVTSDDIETFARRGVAVAYCPRTHSAFGHPPHSFIEMLAAGVNVCVGTDSLASNPSLSILEEIRFLHRRRPDTPAHTLLAMATVHGARALGLAEAVGSLEVGMIADVTVVSLHGTDGRDAMERMLRAKGDPIATYVGGSRYEPVAASSDP